MGTGMNHNQKSFLIAGLIVIGILITLSGCGCIEPEKETGEVTTNNSLQNTTQDIKTTPSIPAPADIIMAVKFEPARPCQSCANLGNLKINWMR